MRHLLRLLAAAALALSTAAAHADLGDQLFKLLPDDGEAGEQFGVSVAISGTTAIVGTRYPDNSDFSSAYLFDTTTGAQMAKLLPDDGEEWDFFGLSVAISGTTAIVGAPWDDDNGNNAGSAYLFDTITGQQITRLLPDDGWPWDAFGVSVAISETTAIVGATGDDVNGVYSGAVYLFDTATGAEIAKLLPDDNSEGDYFGYSVAISGAVVIVGAGWDDDNGDDSGSAYLFDTTTGQQIAKLLPNDGAEDDNFGISVAIRGTIAIVGAWRDDDNGTNSGSAYVFNVATGHQITKLLPDDGMMGDEFGRSVAINDAFAIVGANKDDDNGDDSGLAYVFDIATGQEIAKLLPDDGTLGDEFGRSVAISDAIAIIGAVKDDDNGTRSGSAYLFAAAYASACPWDFDGDGAVGPFDLALLLGNWGPCADPDNCPADLDGNGEVGPFDLALVLGNWGPCK